jgi:hypothetical protein
MQDLQGAPEGLASREKRREAEGSVVPRNSFGYGPRAETGLAEPVHLGLVWNAELGRGKKKDGEVEMHRRKPTGRLRASIDRG